MRTTPMRPAARPLPRLLAVAAFVLLGSLLVVAPAAAQGTGPAPGTDFPSFTVTDLEGNEIEIGEVLEAGKPAVVEIWATWCAICAALAPQFEELSEAYGDDVSIVAIAVAINQTREDVAAHVESRGHDWPFVYDGDGNAVRALEAFGTGIVITVDRDGKVVAASPGPGRDLIAEVEALLDR